MNSRLMNSGIVLGLLSGFAATFPPLFSHVAMESEVFIMMVGFPFLAPLLSGFFRDFFGFLSALVIAIKQKKIKEALSVFKSGDGWKYALTIGLISSVSAIGLFMSIYFAGPIYGVTLSMTYPIVGAILSHFCMKNKLAKMGWVAVIFCVIGAILVTYTPNTTNYINLPLGIVFGLVSSFAFGLEGIVAEKNIGTVSDNVAVLIKYGTSAALQLVFFMPFALGTPSVGGYVALGQCFLSFEIIAFFLVGFTSWCSFWFYVKGISLLGAPTTMALCMTNTLWNVLFSIILFGAVLSNINGVGIMVVFGGLLLLTYAQNIDAKKVARVQAI